MPPPDRLPHRVVVSVRRGRLPRPGPARRGWHWDDVLNRPPPSRDGGGGGAYAVRHGLDAEDDDPELHVAHATVVTVRTSGDPDLLVEEVVAVEPRVLAQVLVAERHLSRTVAAGSRAGLQIVAARSEALSQRVGGRPGVAIQRSTSLTVGALRWTGRTLRETVHALVEAPDRFWVGARAADAHLKARHERKALLRGLVDPHSLSREGKVAALFLGLASLGALALAVTVGVALARPELAVAWRAILSYFALGVGSTLLFPFFPEFRFDDVAAVVGAPAAVAAIALGMTAGGWLVLFLGDEMHGALKRSVRPDSPFARLLDRAEALARRHGLWVAIAVLAVPYGPDTPVFYTLALVRTPPVQYLVGTLLGCAIRFTLVAWIAGAG